MTQKTNQYTISLSDCLEDIASNFIYAESEYSQVPPFVLVPIMFEAVNDLIDEFSSSPEKYISDRLKEKSALMTPPHSNFRTRH